MLQSMEVRLKPELDDCVGRNLAGTVRAALGLEVASARVVKVFTVEGLDLSALERALAAAALHDPVLHDASLTAFASDADWIIEVAFRPGVTDNEGRTARETLDAALVAIEEIMEQAQVNPQALHDAPVTTPVGRPDEVGAARKPVLRYEFE